MGGFVACSILHRGLALAGVGVTFGRLGHELAINLLHVGLDALALPVHAVDEVEKFCVCRRFDLLVAIGGFFGNLSGADRIKLRLLDRKIHRDQSQRHLNLAHQIGLLSADESTQVLLEQHLEDLDSARVPRDKLDHGGAEL